MLNTPTRLIVLLAAIASLLVLSPATRGQTDHGNHSATAEAAATSAGHAAADAEHAGHSLIKDVARGIAEMEHDINEIPHDVHAAAGKGREAAVSQWIEHHVFLNLHEEGFNDSWHVLGLSIPMPGFLNVHVVMLIIASVILLLAFLLFYDYKARVPHGITNLLEVMVKFVRDEIAVPAMGSHEGRKFTPLLCTFFFLILTLNLMGLVPLFSTATGNFMVTTGLATMVFLTMTVGAIFMVNPINWFKSFMPHGVPWPVLILIVPLEIAGLFIKTFALAIRLFANMMAGHIVLFSFIGLMAVYGWLAAPAMILALGVYGLETFVAFLQAYVFTVLSAIFIGHVVHPAH